MSHTHEDLRQLCRYLAEDDEWEEAFPPMDVMCLLDDVARLQRELADQKQWRESVSEPFLADLGRWRDRAEAAEAALAASQLAEMRAALVQSKELLRAAAPHLGTVASALQVARVRDAIDDALHEGRAASDTM